MRAAQGSDYGDIDARISVEDGIKVPHLSDLPKRQQKTRMVIRTLAVALAPGDCRVLSGLTRELQGPPSMPYIPGGDACGIVMELPEGVKDLPFAVGDCVVAGFTGGPRGAMAEYAIVSTTTADKVPPGMSAVDAVALVGAAPAIFLADRIRPGERVLVMGAGGGVGAHFCQCMRQASYVIGVASTQTGALSQPPMSYHEVVDHTTTDHMALDHLINDKVDVIVDLAGYGYKQLEERVARKEPLIVKSASQGGRFITTVPPKGPTFEIHSILGALRVFLFPCLWKALVSRTCTRRSLPKYSFALEIPENRARATRPMWLAAGGKLKAVMDPAGPFPFTTQGVRAAFHKQSSRHAHGKVVVSIAQGP
eukprot:CAMPEP_0171073724 /NCGR_PEP_ID=MMETSP0766_2-20121228/11685_1 /TAXON_ID=439317 /ORGANISM="Gambierdiscus australes, Strain CAWD 149" /LENGTH=365 /DNA_ID=CAMNT_0011530443 /DNA_START=9 /DNA_END=1106 /DNA_ORIENTATION=+